MGDIRRPQRSWREHMPAWQNEAGGINGITLKVFIGALGNERGLAHEVVRAIEHPSERLHL